MRKAQFWTVHTHTKETNKWVNCVCLLCGKHSVQGFLHWYVRFTVSYIISFTPLQCCSQALGLVLLLGQRWNCKTVSHCVLQNTRRSVCIQTLITSAVISNIHHCNHTDREEQNFDSSVSVLELEMILIRHWIIINWL